MSGETLSLLLSSKIIDERVFAVVERVNIASPCSSLQLFGLLESALALACSASSSWTTSNCVLKIE